MAMLRRAGKRGMVVVFALLLFAFAILMRTTFVPIDAAHAYAAQGSYGPAEIATQDSSGGASKISVGTGSDASVKKTLNGWKKTNGKKRYYVDGKALTGGQQIKGKWYYFNKKGVMQTGLKKIDGRKYFFRKNGSLLTSAFKTIKGKKYYFTASGAMATVGLARGYIIAYNGVCSKIDQSPTGNKDADARRVASLIAQSCGPKGKQTDVQYVSRAVCYVSNFCAEANYTTEGTDYQTAYGVFIAREFSCAGSARALGLVLDYLGYAWTHVNAGQWTHQWCRLDLDGKVGYADAALLPTGTVGYGMTSPVAKS